MKKLFLFLLFYTFSVTTFAWENHSDMTHVVLNEWSKQDKTVSVYLKKSIKTESLKSFLEATKTSLPIKMIEIEKWLVKHETGYSPVPNKIKYNPKRIQCNLDITTCFKKAIRINLDVPLPLIVYDANHVYSHQTKSKKINNLKLIMLPSLISQNKNMHFTSVLVGSNVSREDVISAAASQPDFGLDIFLYENNPSSFGKLYGFGKQPLGVPNVVFSSQILFHMSAYRQGQMVYIFMPEIKNNYPEARAYLYLKLSQFSAKTGHAYWSAVFLGWGLHYIQDMTQPFHSELSLGLNHYLKFYTLFQSLLGNNQPLDEFKSIQANRHVLFESLTTHLLTAKDNATKKYRDVLHAGLMNRDVDKQIPECHISNLYLRNEMNIRMEKISYKYVMLLRKTLPLKYVDDANFDAIQFTHYRDLFNKEMSAEQKLKFSEELSKVLKLFAAYTRKCILSYGIGLKKN